MDHPFIFLPNNKFHCDNHPLSLSQKISKTYLLPTWWRFESNDLDPPFFQQSVHEIQSAPISPSCSVKIMPASGFVTAEGKGGHSRLKNLLRFFFYQLDPIQSRRTAIIPLSEITFRFSPSQGGGGERQKAARLLRGMGLTVHAFGNGLQKYKCKYKYHIESLNSVRM